MEKKYSEIKLEIEEKKIEAVKPKHSNGSLNELQNMISDIYDKINNLNERLNVQEKKI